MKIYDFLSGIAVTRKKYAIKFFFIAFPVILLAVAELVVFSLMSTGRLKLPLAPVVITGAALVIIFTVLIIYLFNNLVSPLRMAERALVKYIESDEIPQLPVNFEDEAGTVMKDIQTTLMQLNALLVEKSDMIDLLSHDLRSPVARIHNLCYLIKTEDSSEKNIYADYITNECNGLLRMLENILLMLKEDNSAFTLANVNLKQLITETVRFFDFAIAEKNLMIQTCIDETLVIHVQQDLFTQAVRNIIGNAIKFSQIGKTITITGKQITDQISISIQDEGLGFKQTDIQKIFDRFTAAGKKGTRGEASIGLGLYLSKKIIEKHDGKLLAESEGLNKGASFTIILHQLITKKPQDKMVKKPKKYAMPVSVSRANFR